MNIKLLVSVLSVFGSLVVAADNRKPLVVSFVTAKTGNQYSVVQTTIYKDANKADGAPPIVTRAQLGIVGGKTQQSKPLNAPLEIPTAPVTLKTYGATAILNKVGTVVSSVGVSSAQPEVAAVGTAISAASVIADYAVTIAEDKLSEMYGNQQIKINLLEILPIGLYTIDTETNKVNVTDEFIAYMPKYQKALSDYLEAFSKYRQYEIEYTKRFRVRQAEDPSGNISPDLWKKLIAIDTQVGKPLLEDKNKKEVAFSNMKSPYRIAVVMSPSNSDNRCTSGSGAFEFDIIYYLGAQQTNQIAVKYCVPSASSNQFISVEVVKNDIQPTPGTSPSGYQHFLPGGIRIKAESPLNISFAQATGSDQGNLAASQTEVFNWFTKMLTNQNGNNIAQFMLPFDLFTLRKQVQEEYDQKQDAKTKQILDSIDKLTPQIQSTIGAFDAAKKAQAEKLLGDTTKTADETTESSKEAAATEATAQATGARPPAETTSVLTDVAKKLGTDTVTTLVKSATDAITKQLAGTDKDKPQTAPAA
ncbi:hypothetical protein H0X48_02070 [Candidatus Dependentiae bacterium]|nr:hypothetical protein [Candidatus Dependentiae bacterium]